MSRLDAMLARYRLPSWRGVDRIIILFVLVFCVWAWFANLDRVISANGEVIPQGNVRMIQHLEGGIIIGLPVSEGSLVKKGEPLVELDLATSGINRDELRVQLDGLRMKRARLLGEANGVEPEYPADIAKSRPTLLEAEKRSMRARQAEYRSGVTVAEQQVVQRERQLADLESQRKSIRDSLKLAERELAIIEKIYAQNLASELQLIAARRSVQEKQGQIESLGEGIASGRAALLESRSQLDQMRQSYRRMASEELGSVEQSIAQLQERLVRADDQEQRAVIRSPIDGIVKKMGYNTIGGVVQPGAPIMEIVPSEERLVVEARLNPGDRGYVREGQRAVIKVSAYDFIRYGSLEGEVNRIAADTETGSDSRSPPYYKLIISTTRNYLGETEGEYPITPGMQAVVDVHIGEQSVWSYLVRPVLKLKEESFREP